MTPPQKHAIKMAKESKCNYLMGAVLAKRNHILGKACNKANSSPKGSGPFSTKHAETNAVFSFLRLNGQLLKGHEMYVARLSRTGLFGMARPCGDCLKFLKKLGIKTIHYTTRTGWQREKI